MPTPNVTSPGFVSALPDSWIERIFLKLEGRYGSLFLDRWRGCDMANVKATWAEELAGFKDRPEAIAYALRSLADERFPPTLPEFLAACRRAPLPPPAGLAIEHKADKERAEKIIAEALAVMRKSPIAHESSSEC